MEETGVDNSAGTSDQRVRARSYKTPKKMEHSLNENDDGEIFRSMAKYNFDKPIKITFEDDDSDETDTVNNLPLLENSAQHSSSRNENNINSAIDQTLADQNCYSNVSFQNMESELNIEGNYNRQEYLRRTVQNQQPAAMYNPLREIESFDSNFISHNYLNSMTTNQRTHFLKLLDSISENVIIIAKCYNYYNIQYVIAKDQNAQQNYRNYKEYYYRQLYSIINKYVLPHEHNHVFINGIIKRTIEIAKRKQYFKNVNINLIETIVLDMIQWAKQKMKSLEIKNNQSHYPRVLANSVQPPAYSSSIVNSRQPITTPPTQSVPPPAYNVSSVNTRQPVTRPPIQSVPPLAYSMSSVNTRQPITTPPTQSVPPPAFNVFSVNTRQPITRPPMKSVPPLAYNMSSVNTRQPISRPPTQPSPPPYNISSLNTRQSKNIPIPPLLQTSAPVAREPYNQPVQPPPIGMRNINIQQPVTRPQPHIPPQSTSNNLPNVTMCQPRSTLPVPIVTNEETIAKDGNNVCLFSTGQPGSEISISIDSEIAKLIDDIDSYNKACKTPPQYQPRQLKTKKNANTIHSNLQKNKYDSHNLKQPSATSNTESNRTIRKLLGDVNSSYSAKRRRTKSTVETSQSQLQENHDNCPNSTQTSVTSNAESTKNMQPVIYPNQYCHKERLKYKEYDNNECQLRLSRSESRDSGFGSPVLASILTGNDNYITHDPDCTGNQECIPEISHVTSMNPNVEFIPSGACKICGTITRNKCLACYGVYYCGKNCQMLDWPLHMQICQAQ